MMQVTVGGVLLGEIYLDRTSTRAQMLHLSLDSTELRVREHPTAAGSLQPGLLEVLGKGDCQMSLETQRTFGDIDGAAWWMMDLAEARGYHGPVEFKTSEGRKRIFDYGIATITGAEPIGSLVRVEWRLVLGRKFVC